MGKRLDRIRIPVYTKGEEIFNMVSHIVGGALGITALTLCVIFAALHHNVYGIVSGAIFGANMIILYCISSIYHGLKPQLTAKKVFRVLDHCAIYLLIAGTYTPFALCTVRSANTALGWVVFGVVWGISVLGIVLNAINMEKFKTLSQALYLGLGWCIVFTWKIISAGIGKNGMILLIAGGVCYTVGAVIYGLLKKYRYSHSIFHLFIVAGSLLHFLCVLLHVM
ncbi:MAG: hemolysin III family protein [Lachnospiraceae bacterium]|jgi:hemolysin III|nr:hemolysin III family protein [Lachnospiraceae bacterium]